MYNMSTIQKYINSLPVKSHGVKKTSRHLSQSMQEVNQIWFGSLISMSSMRTQSKCVDDTTDINRKYIYIIGSFDGLTSGWWADSWARRRCPNRWRKCLPPQYLPRSQTQAEGVQHWEGKNTPTSHTVSPQTSPIIWHVDAETVNRRGLL